MKRKLLYAEDDGNLRAATAAMLRHHGFEVVAVSCVAEALQAISSQHFDLLISDLNLGEAGDGFTVTSAMRRVQPHCPTLILTGYPAFEAALTSIQNQVDDFLLKPADIKALVGTIRNRIEKPEQRHMALRKSLAEFLTEHRGAIIARVLQSMRMHPRLSTLPLTDQERVDHLDGAVTKLIEVLNDESAPEKNEQNASDHGEIRREQGYSAVMLVDDLRLLDAAIYELVSENLLGINLSRLIPDLGKLNQSIEAQLQDSLRAFQQDSN